MNDEFRGVMEVDVTTVCDGFQVMHTKDTARLDGLNRQQILLF
jgi:hypothetical protein